MNSAPIFTFHALNPFAMNDSYIENIHRYLDGSMPVDEKAAFEHALKTDSKLHADFQFEAQFLAAMDEIGERKTRQQIAETAEKLRETGFFNQQSEAEKPSFSSLSNLTSHKKIVDMKQILAIAAAIAVVVLGAIWLLNPTPAVDLNRVFTDNYRPETARAKAIAESLASLGFAGEKTERDTLHDGIALYEAGKYEQSVALLTRLLETHQAVPDTAHYFLALGHLNCERYARAIEFLQPLTLEPGCAFRQDATWYLGLCFLKSDGGQAMACQTFESLANDPNYKNHRQAKAMRDMLCK